MLNDNHQSAVNCADDSNCYHSLKRRRYKSINMIRINDDDVNDHNSDDNSMINSLTHDRDEFYPNRLHSSSTNYHTKHQRNPHPTHDQQYHHYHSYINHRCRKRQCLNTIASSLLFFIVGFCNYLHTTQSFSIHQYGIIMNHYHKQQQQHIRTLPLATSISLSMSSSDNNSENNSNHNTYQESLTAPEVNVWTNIMTDPDAAFSNENGDRKYGYEQNNLSFQHPSLNNGKNGESFLSTSASDALISNATISISSSSSSSPSMKTLDLDSSSLSNEDENQLNLYWSKLLPHITYLGTSNMSQIRNALQIAYIAHKHQYRKSGEPFIIHPIEVAILLTSLQMDVETIISGLLHDTVEDTDLTFAQIESYFGSTVKSIVEGETKVSKLPKLNYVNSVDEQAENLRQMFIAMTDDYRIIIVKLADRLHNMRTLQHMKPEKQLKISKETLDIFAPLAHRMGIWNFKSELEDISFKYLFPTEYEKLKMKLDKYEKKLNETLIHSQEKLEKVLASDGVLMEQSVDVKVYGRTKELYSLYHKMKTKGEDDLDHITDVVALRVIIEPKMKNKDGGREINEPDCGVWLCYHVLGLVQHLPGFQPVPTKVKDYISFPKPNGYQSLHTALILNGQTIEVQIRTSAMHKIAEYGMASHWAYKDGKARQLSDSNSQEKLNDLYNTPWLSSIKEWQDEVLCSRDFVDCVRRELLGKRVFVFLRNGKILNLAKGSTVIDAAFQIHTEVGLTMYGVEINGKPVPFSYELQNGDVVSVLTGDGQPATDWMRYAKIRSTRSKLRSYFRRKQRQNLRDAGSIILMEFLNKYSKVIKESSFLEEPFEVPTTIEEMNQFLPGKTNYQDVEELLIEIGGCHDRNVLRTAMAKIFLVPQKTLANAESKKKQLLSGQALDAVNAKRQSALDVGAALEEEDGNYDDDDINGIQNGSSMSINGNTLIANGSTEVADPEHVCPSCLPIFGDDIIGTRPHGMDSNDFVTTVHRCSCDIVLKAKHKSKGKQSDRKYNNHDSSITNGDSIANGSSLRRNGRRLKSSLKNRLKRLSGGKSISWSQTSTSDVKSLDLVDLIWDKSYAVDEQFLFLAEISLICEDRKLLLADCSEVVSDMSEIVKTGSLSTKEHAILNFLVKIESLDHLQKLMNSLREIPSVMSVERTFGSTL